MKTKTFSKRKKRLEESEPVKMDREVRSHKGWKGALSLQESFELLRSQDPYSYVILAGYDKHHYVVSYVDSHGTVKYKNIRIVHERGQYYFMNASTSGPSTNFDRLIINCFKCSPEKCKPLA